MATLKKKKKLICKAAEGNDPFLGLVFKRLLNHFRAENNAHEKSHDDCFYIKFLYGKNHKGKSFQYIADNIFYIGLSTLEERRQIYISIFYFYLEIEREEYEAAMTKNT